MKKGLKNLSRWWQQLNIRNLQHKCGGFPDQYNVTAIVYFSFFIFGMIINIVGKNDFTYAFVRTFPFLVAGGLLLTKIKNKVDIFIDIFLMVVITILSIEGTFSGIVFLYLLLFRTNNKIQIYLLLLLSFISLTINAVLYDFYTPQITIQFILYIFMTVKYYYTIHLPTKENKEAREHLKSQLFRFGPAAELSDFEIKAKYPFMTDRRIKDLRGLSEGKSAKDLSWNNGISYSAQSKEHMKMMRGFSEVTESEINTVAHLVRVGIETGIIQVRFINR